MTGAFADLHDQLRNVARELLGDEVDHEARWRQVAGAGWLGLEVPEAVGGSGATFAEAAVVLEELGRASSEVPFFATAVLGVGALLCAEPTSRRDALLREVAGGNARVAVALVPHADALIPVPPFRLDAAGRLTGRAELVLDAGAADHLLVLAEVAGGPALVHMGLEELVSEELTRLDAPVLDATRSFADVQADSLAVAPEAVWPFGEDPAASAQAVLDRAAVAAAADALGAASAMLEATVAYVAQRHQFDRPIGSFQAVKHQCSDALVALRIGRELLDDAADAVAMGRRVASLAASRAKAHLGDSAVQVVGTALQLHGGIGYTWGSGIHRHLKRVLLDRALFGSPSAHRRRIADLNWGPSQRGP